MERIDVEELVTWAFRAQAVEASLRGMRAAVGMGGPSAGGAGSLAGLVALGTRVQSSGAGLAALGADTADDALVVYDAVLALPGIWVEAAPAAAGLPAGADGFSLHWADELGRAGIRGDRAIGFDRAGVMLDPDGFRAWEPAVLLIQHGRSGARPEVMEDFRVDVAERPRDSAGRYVADRDAYRRTVADVVWCRMGYAVWRAGLVRLAADLARGGRLTRYEVAGPAARLTPWIRIGRGKVDESALGAVASTC